MAQKFKNTTSSIAFKNAANFAKHLQPQSIYMFMEVHRIYIEGFGSSICPHIETVPCTWIPARIPGLGCSIKVNAYTKLKDKKMTKAKRNNPESTKEFLPRLHIQP
jgi:hypothetical protein